MKKYLLYISQNYSFAILRPIQKLLLERGDTVKWFFEGQAVNPKFLSSDEKKLNSVTEIIDYKPDAVLVPANTVPTFIPGLKVAVFHGFDAGKVDKKGNNDHFKARGCFDLYCTQGPNTTMPFKLLQGTSSYFSVIETGWSTLDALFSLKQKKPSNKKPTILFCSTFSKKLSCAKQLLPMISEFCKTGEWQWIVQFHPKMEQETIELYKSLQNEHLTYIETDDVIPLLKRADVMLCDTSSVITMFMLQNKPVVTFKNINPVPYLLDVTDASLLHENITLALSPPSSLINSIESMVKDTHPYNDGLSSQRVIDAIDQALEGSHPVARKKPTNFIRNLKFRKRLNYWVF